MYKISISRYLFLIEILLLSLIHCQRYEITTVFILLQNMVSKTFGELKVVSFKMFYIRMYREEGGPVETSSLGTSRNVIFLDINMMHTREF